MRCYPLATSQKQVDHAGQHTLGAGSGKVSGRPTVQRRTSASGLRWPGPACTGTGCFSHIRQGSVQCALGLPACGSALWIPSRTQRIAYACSTRHDLCTKRRACLMALCQAQGCQCKRACGGLTRARAGASVCSGAPASSAKAGAVASGAGLPGSERRPLLLHTLLRAPCRTASRLVHICGTGHLYSDPARCMVTQGGTPTCQGQADIQSGKGVLWEHKALLSLWSVLTDFMHDLQYKELHSPRQPYLSISA